MQRELLVTVTAETPQECDALIEQLARACCDIANSSESESASLHLADLVAP